MTHDTRWLRRKLGGAYEVDLNVSHDGLGSLFHPEGGTIVGDLTERVRNTYGSVFSSLSTNGTTASNVLMIGTAMLDGQDIILNRASHTSLYGAMVIFDARPHYLPTRLDPTFGIPLGASLQEVAALMDQTPKASAVALTAPNYFGVVPPLRRHRRSHHAGDSGAMAELTNLLPADANARFDDPSKEKRERLMEQASGSDAGGQVTRRSADLSRSVAGEFSLVSKTVTCARARGAATIGAVWKLRTAHASLSSACASSCRGCCAMMWRCAARSLRC